MEFENRFKEEFNKIKASDEQKSKLKQNIKFELNESRIKYGAVLSYNAASRKKTAYQTDVGAKKKSWFLRNIKWLATSFAAVVVLSVVIPVAVLLWGGGIGDGNTKLSAPTYASGGISLDSYVQSSSFGVQSLGVNSNSSAVNTRNSNSFGSFNFKWVGINYETNKLMWSADNKNKAKDFTVNANGVEYIVEGNSFSLDILTVPGLYVIKVKANAASDSGYIDSDYTFEIEYIVGTPGLNFNSGFFNSYQVDLSGFDGSGALYIPSVYNNRPVTSIKNGYGLNIQSLVLPAEIREIEVDCFKNCKNLSSVVFAKRGGIEAITSSGFFMIERGAFSGCANITSITLQNTGYFRIMLGGNTFKDCINLQSVYLDDVVAYLNTGTNGDFSGCVNLTDVTLVNDTSISSDTLMGCNIQNIDVQNSNSYIVESNCLIDKEFEVLNRYTLIIGFGAASITIPDYVTDIESYAFYNNQQLTKIIIPYSVTHMGMDVFKGCTNLTIYVKGYTNTPLGWMFNWNGGRPVVWNYSGG